MNWNEYDPNNNATYPNDGTYLIRLQQPVNISQRFHVAIFTRLDHDTNQPSWFLQHENKMPNNHVITHWCQIIDPI